MLKINQDTSAADLRRVGDFMLYRKKPVLVTAMRLTEPVEIETLEGTMIGNVGDYLICGVNGEYYPCKPDIFDKTYEPV